MQTQQIQIARLVAAKKRLKLTDAEIALESLTSKETVSALLDEESAQIPRTVLSRIAETLHLDLNDIITQ